MDIKICQLQHPTILNLVLAQVDSKLTNHPLNIRSVNCYSTAISRYIMISVTSSLTIVVSMYLIHTYSLGRTLQRLPQTRAKVVQLKLHNHTDHVGASQTSAFHEVSWHMAYFREPSVVAAATSASLKKGHVTWHLIWTRFGPTSSSSKEVKYSWISLRTNPSLWILARIQSHGYECRLIVTSYPSNRARNYVCWNQLRNEVQCKILSLPAIRKLYACLLCSLDVKSQLKARLCPSFQNLKNSHRRRRKTASQFKPLNHHDRAIFVCPVHPVCASLKFRAF
jgi:hypothetical protein